jgi:hypothetical protein
MDLINWVIENSKWNSIIHVNTKCIYVRRFAPHMTLRWSRREILEDKRER